MPDYRQLDFASLPQPDAAAVPNGVVAPRPADRLLEGEEAAAQQALAAQAREYDFLLASCHQTYSAAAQQALTVQVRNRIGLSAPRPQKVAPLPAERLLEGEMPLRSRRSQCGRRPRVSCCRSINRVKVPPQACDHSQQCSCRQTPRAAVPTPQH